jgi:hypothetical protein
VIEEARTAGLTWERLPEPKPPLRLEIYLPTGQEHIFYLGPHTPRLTPKEIELLHDIWLDVSEGIAPREIHHHDVVHFALNELQKELSEAKRGEVVRRLQDHLEEVRARQTA